MDRRILWAGAGVFVLAFLVSRKRAEAALLPEIPGGRLGSARVGPQPGTIEGDTLIFEQNLARELEKKGPEILAAAGIESLPDDYTLMDVVKGGLPGQGSTDAGLSIDTTSVTAATDMSLSELALTALDVVATGLLTAIENVTGYFDITETVPNYVSDLNVHVSDRINQWKENIAAEEAAEEATTAPTSTTPSIADIVGVYAPTPTSTPTTSGNGDSGDSGGAPGSAAGDPGDPPGAAGGGVGPE